MIAPDSTTSAPYARVADTLGRDAPVGMYTRAGMPNVVADHATPCAWLPALAATTPRARSSSESPVIRTYAPRGLNEPVRWRFSHFSHTSPPHRSDSARDATTGVRRITGASVCTALSIWAAVMITPRP